MSEDTNKAFDTYDRQIGALKGLPDVIEVKPSTVRVTIPLLGLSQTFIFQTIRQRELGYHVFLETVSRDGAIRFVLQPQDPYASLRHLPPHYYNNPIKHPHTNPYNSTSTY